MSDDLIEMMKNRDASLKQYLKSKKEDDKKEIRRMRNMVNIAIRNARNEYIKNQLEIHQKNPKKFWKQISDILPSKSENQNYDNIKNNLNDSIPKEKLPDFINTYFATIGKQLDKNFINIPMPPNNNQNNQNNLLPLVGNNANILKFFRMINIQQLEKEINGIAVHKSSGIQNLSSYVLKLCFDVLKDQLLVIMNKSMFQGYFPKLWRRAIIVPIPKIPIPKEVGDLRPIALTPLPGKILERFVHTQLMEHLDNNNLLNNIQNGFRKNHSTIDTIFKFTTQLQSYKNSKLNTIALYIDLKKAFDTVNHSILLGKLKSLKIVGNVLKWLKTYLLNRKQTTQLFGQISKEEEVLTGVPQGSILGPTLFLCYINDIFTVCKSSEMLLYADDTVIYKKISDAERFLDMHNFKQDVLRLYEWCQKNRLSINVKKTKAVFYPYSNVIKNDINNKIVINRQEIQYVNLYLYLGIDIDENLTFKKYFSTLFKSVSHKMYILRKIRPMLSTKAALDIVKTMICSIIDYGNIFIDTCTAQDLQDLQILQNYALRCCYNIADPRDEHVINLHSNANVNMLVVRRRKQQLMCIWRNIQTGFIEIYCPVRITRGAQGRSIRLPIPRTEQYKKSVFYIGCKAWNELEAGTRNIEDLQEFKRMIQ